MLQPAAQRAESKWILNPGENTPVGNYRLCISFNGTDDFSNQMAKHKRRMDKYTLEVSNEDAELSMGCLYIELQRQHVSQ